jgi:hypothetical protein
MSAVTVLAPATRLRQGTHCHAFNLCCRNAVSTTHVSSLESTHALIAGAAGSSAKHTCWSSGLCLLVLVRALGVLLGERRVGMDGLCLRHGDGEYRERVRPSRLAFSSMEEAWKVHSVLYRCTVAILSRDAVTGEHLT